MKKTTKKGAGYLSLIIVFCFLVYLGSWFGAAGSYPSAERYEFSISEDSLLVLISEFKREHPEYNIKEVAELDHKDKYWNFRYFYYPDKDLKLMTYVRAGINKKEPTHFAFVSTSPRLKMGNWTDVNNSFWWWKNNSEKEEFEERILKPIREKLKN